MGEIEAFVINKNYQGQGVGKGLLEKGIICAQDYFKDREIKPRCLYLFTRSNNLHAQNLYKKFGFKIINKIGKIYKDNEPEEIIMSLFFN